MLEKSHALQMKWISSRAGSCFTHAARFTTRNIVSPRGNAIFIIVLFLSRATPSLNIEFYLHSIFPRVTTRRFPLDENNTFNLWLWICSVGKGGGGAFTIIKSKLTAIGGTNKGVVVQSIGFLTKELPFPILASSLFSPSILRNRLSSCFGVRVFFLPFLWLKVPSNRYEGIAQTKVFIN